MLVAFLCVVGALLAIVHTRSKGPTRLTGEDLERLRRLSERINQDAIVPFE